MKEYALDGSVRNRFEKKLAKLIGALTLRETSLIAAYRVL